MIKLRNIHLIVFLGALTLLAACRGADKGSSGTEKDKPSVVEGIKLAIPQFKADSAYQYVADQVAFGPRNPGSSGHEACRKYLVNQLERWADKTIEQNFSAKSYDGSTLKGVNIIGVFNPQATTRIVLAAHWDTRFIADHDPDPAMRDKPILGADDGASGVGVLLEIARLLSEQPLPIGVDIVLFDLEDQGNDGGGSPDSWCLGAQYWSRNPHVKGYKAKYGILLDMVGAKGARFTLEGTSMHFAPDLMTRVWKLAQSMGFGNYFVNERTGPITDDHLFVNQIARIPMIDIINKPIETSTGFGYYWHTHQDNMDVIDPATLKAVGQVVIATLFNEAMGTL